MTVGVKSKKTKTALRSKESEEDPTTPGRFIFQGQFGVEGLGAWGCVLYRGEGVRVEEVLRLAAHTAFVC